MVIALIAIVATLAVSKVGSIREASERKVSLANQKAVERAVESFMTFSRRGIDRLDALVDDEVSRESGNGFFDANGTSMAAQGAGFYLGPDDKGYPLPEDVAEQASGLTPALVNQVFTPYSLSQNEVYALNNHGFKYVMRHTTYAGQSPRAAYGDKGDDGAYLPSDADLGLDSNKSACIPRAFTNGMVVAAISPFTPMGREIYRGCGVELLATKESAAEYRSASAEVVDEVMAKGGALLAFGLGDAASIVGSPDAGLESAPVATYPNKKYYSRYILLFRVETATRAGNVVFAGVIDPCGNTETAARAAIKSL